MQIRRYSDLFAVVLASSISLIPSLLAQTPSLDWRNVHPINRITEAIDGRNAVRLLGNTHPMARPENDAGPVPGDHRLEKMILVLRSDDSQRKSLEALLHAQTDPSSPLYHGWLLPEEFGRHFGVSENDVVELTAWLRSGGFDVDEISTGKRT